MKNSTCLLLLFLAGCSTTTPPAPVPTPAIAAKAKPQPPPVKPPVITKSLTSTAPTVTIAWSASPDASVTGYRIYQGVASRRYTNSIAVPSTVLGGTITTAPGLTNYLTATAFSSSLESVYANEVQYFPPGVPPPTTSNTWVSISVTMQSSTNLSDWVTVTNLPGLNYTNPTVPMTTYRAVMQIIETQIP